MFNAKEEFLRDEDEFSSLFASLLFLSLASILFSLAISVQLNVKEQRIKE